MLLPFHGWPNLLQVASVDLRKNGLVLKPSSKKAAEEGAAAAAAAAAAAEGAAADPWGGVAVGSLLQEGAVVTQVLQRPAEQGGGLVELTVTGRLQGFVGVAKPCDFERERGSGSAIADAAGLVELTVTGVFKVFGVVCHRQPACIV
jgi:hypothetical protein